MENSLFYNKLPTYDASVSEILGQPEAFTRIPNDWHIVITDIKDSTKAINQGLSQVVNLIATGSIIAALNIATALKIDIPFFFGGDGATLIIPSIALQETMAALKAHQNNVREEFDMDLRVGSYAVSKIYESANELKVAKVHVNALFSIPIVLGNGLQVAERYIKSHYTSPNIQSNNDVPLSLEGMECRWNKIPPPNSSDEVLCLLVDVVENSDQAMVFKNVLEKIESIYGTHQNRNPISIPKLKLDIGLQKIRTELRTKRLNYNFRELFKEWVNTLVGKFWYFPNKSGKQYLAELVQLSDIFVLDGRINMVISGTSESRKRLVDFLEKEESEQRLIFGVHVSEESIISCYVRNRKANHIHFVDGGAGGYTKAATMLKGKIKTRKTA